MPRVTEMFERRRLLEAHDTIASLRQEVETLKEALKPFADAVYSDSDNGDVTVSYHSIEIEHWFRACRLHHEHPDNSGDRPAPHREVRRG